MSIQEQLAEIKPGKNYPAFTRITETVEGKEMVISFALQSYYVGMYAAISIPGQSLIQSGDHNNKSFVTKLKKDIKKAIDRGATVEIGEIRLIKTTP